MYPLTQTIYKMCQARVKTTSFVIPSASASSPAPAEGRGRGRGEEGTHVVWRTTACHTKTDRTVTTDDGDSKIPICPACIIRYLTKHKADTTWLGWYDGSVPKTAHIFDSNWFWWRVYEGWVAQAAFEDKTRAVTRKELMDWIRPSMFLSNGKKEDPDVVDELTTKLSSCSVACPIQGHAKEEKKAKFQSWLSSPEGQSTKVKDRLKIYKEMMAC